MDNENPDQTEPLTDSNQPTTSTGTCIPQDLHTDAKAILRLPQSVPKALTIQKGKSKGKQNITEAMTILVGAMQLNLGTKCHPLQRPDHHM